MSIDVRSPPPVPELLPDGFRMLRLSTDVVCSVTPDSVEVRWRTRGVMLGAAFVSVLILSMWVPVIGLAWRSGRLSGDEVFIVGALAAAMFLAGWTLAYHDRRERVRKGVMLKLVRERGRWMVQEGAARHELETLIYRRGKLKIPNRWGGEPIGQVAVRSRVGDELVERAVVTFRPVVGKETVLLALREAAAVVEVECPMIAWSEYMAKCSRLAEDGYGGKRTAGIESK